MSKIYLGIAVAIFLLGFGYVIHQYGRSQYRLGWTAGQLEAAEQFIIGKDALDAIQDKRPDLDTVIDRLHHGTF